jgi:hypothetical protein
VDAWKRELQRKVPGEAYEIVIKEDTVEAYQAYLALFSTQPDSARVRAVYDRRRVMIAWYTAVTVDTPAAYQAFLASYGDTDLAATARRLMERANSRSLMPNLANTCPCVQPAPPAPQPIQQKATKPVEKKAAKKKKEKEKPVKRTVVRAPVDDPPPPPPQASGPPIIPLGIGIGIMGGMGGRGIGGRPGGYGDGRMGSPGGVRQPMPTGSHRY